jgi:hypothetical protein
MTIQSSRAAKAAGNLYIESNSSVIPVNKNTPEDFITIADKNKLLAYRYEIKQTRQQRDIEMKQKKNLIEKILQTWKEIKETRNKQKFRNTEYKLIIKKLNFEICFKINGKLINKKKLN